MSNRNHRLLTHSTNPSVHFFESIISMPSLILSSSFVFGRTRFLRNRTPVKEKVTDKIWTFGVPWSVFTVYGRSGRNTNNPQSQRNSWELLRPSLFAWICPVLLLTPFFNFFRRYSKTVLQHIKAITTQPATQPFRSTYRHTWEKKYLTSLVPFVNIPP